MSHTVITGEKAPDFTYNTVFENGLRLSDTVKKAKKTFLVFLRYFGCRSCQLDLRDYTAQYSRFVEKDAQLLVVLQSTQESLKTQTKPEDVPYAIICDPEQTLYHFYDIPAAASKEAMASQRGKERVAIAAGLGIVHGEYEGNELQLPAVFLLDSDCNVLYHRRAKVSGDIPDTEEMLAML